MSEEESKPVEQPKGIEGLKKVMIAANKISVVLVKHLKDGLQPGKDAVAIVGELMSNEALKNSIVEAVVSGGQIVPEAKDINLQEGLELAMLQIQLMPELLEALKKSA